MLHAPVRLRPVPQSFHGLSPTKDWCICWQCHSISIMSPSISKTCLGYFSIEGSFAYYQNACRDGGWRSGYNFLNRGHIVCCIRNDHVPRKAGMRRFWFSSSFVWDMFGITPSFTFSLLNFHFSVSHKIVRKTSRIDSSAKTVLRSGYCYYFIYVDLCPFNWLNIYIYYACPDNTNAYFYSDWFINHLLLLLYKYIPIILFLRLKSIRDFLLPSCKCIDW